ncbi:alpha/beta fold hydrolase [Rheinheimera riviphila]|uniref:Alpha/beta fold hydrolase n=1 Tax=Rheinheimera riviphila TaxID=1834037 RepID=A0A437QSN5_9GAMM|nr:alpha/beta fold hydrolase [Rheinheimera riviphila]RVU37521.1 alpha/beta fold hydrolase [Rheinheimera riviphila]
MILHTDITGQGQPLVLIHGLFGSYENLGVIARALQPDFQLMNVDLRNHGRSPRADRMDYPQMAADVFETLDSLQITQCAVLGHSMGGKVAMQMALSEPTRVSKLILADISPVVNEPRHQRILQGLAAIDLTALNDRKQADLLIQPFVDELGVRQFLLKNLYKDPTDQFQWRFNLTALIDNYQQLLAAPESTQPYKGDTLFIKGGNSDYIQAAHQPLILKLFPNAKAKIIQGTGHWLHAEKPAAFSKIVSDFLLR